MASLNFWRAEDLIYQEIGRRVKSTRRRRGLTQTEFGIKINLSRSSIANIESGIQKVTIHSLYQIGYVLKVSIYDLLPENKH
ncbi:helix-turn-helix domain-containing protein [Paenibacillus sp. MAH-36]|uniref:Helix-turn-helix transcriptional regulator n=1 Tax=Paenibacillus violae TaxID=3077234 RepID=A0ABU3RI89_9BACL|nr:helix-turn-helix transcriptional regulator [Paenibacillus sp. PFR10]MDU0204000.1 helix-turn-helix transcriptional regulator [Paenibacillus sp. PFR10]